MVDYDSMCTPRNSVNWGSTRAGPVKSYAALGFLTAPSQHPTALGGPCPALIDIRGRLGTKELGRRRVAGNLKEKEIGAFRARRAPWGEGGHRPERLNKLVPRHTAGYKILNMNGKFCISNKPPSRIFAGGEETKRRWRRNICRGGTGGDKSWLRPKRYSTLGYWTIGLKEMSFWKEN